MTDISRLYKAKKEALRLKSAGDLNASRRVFLDVLSVNQNDQFALTNLAWIALKTGDLVEAERCASIAIKIDGENEYALDSMARIYLQTGRFDEALNHAQYLTEKRKNKPRYQRLLAEILINKGDNERAIEILEKIPGRSFTDSKAEQLLIAAYRKMGKPAPTVTKPGTDRAERRAAKFLAQRRGMSRPRLIFEIEEAFNLEGMVGNPVLTEILGKALFQEREYIRAEPVLKKVLKYNPDNMRIRTFLARCYAIRQDFKRILETLEPVNPNNLDAMGLTLLTQGFFAQGNMRNAKRTLARLEARFPDHPAAVILRGALAVKGDD